MKHVDWRWQSSCAPPTTLSAGIFPFGNSHFFAEHIRVRGSPENIGPLLFFLNLFSPICLCCLVGDKPTCHISTCSSSTLFSEAIKLPPSREFACIRASEVLSRLVRSQLQIAGTSIRYNLKPQDALPLSPRHPSLFSPHSPDLDHLLYFQLPPVPPSTPSPPFLSLMHFTSVLSAAAALRVIRPVHGLLRQPVIR